MGHNVSLSHCASHSHSEMVGCNKKSHGQLPQDGWVGCAQVRNDYLLFSFFMEQKGQKLSTRPARTNRQARTSQAFLSLPQLSLKKSYFLQPLLSFLLALAWACAGVRDHPFKTSAYFRGGGVKNWPNLPTDSSKKLPTVGE